MSERVQQLLHEVRRAASESQYKEPLGQRFPDAHTQGLAALQREVAEEIAFSLGKAGSKVERSMRLLNEILTTVSNAGASSTPLTAAEVDELERAFGAERALAERHLRDLLIQREALGFRRHDDVKQRFVLPRWQPPVLG
jgi:hypothetical protein